jgi:RNA polymerase sigma-70 factor, ECF subfamily
MRPGKRSRASDLRSTGAPPADDLLRGVADRDEKAVAELYDRLAPLTAGLLGRILPDRREAAQVFDEVWRDLRREANALHRQGGSVSAWLMLAARAAGVRRLRAQRGVAEPNHPSGDALRSASAWLPPPSEVEQLEERRELLMKVIRQLPAHQSQALELAFFEGYTESEIATKLGEPLGKVETELCAALKFLRHRLRAVTGLWAANI